jgi:hypothetical protein
MRIPTLHTALLAGAIAAASFSSTAFAGGPRRDFQYASESRVEAADLRLRLGEQRHARGESLRLDPISSPASDGRGTIMLFVLEPGLEANPGELFDLPETAYRIVDALNDFDDALASPPNRDTIIVLLCRKSSGVSHASLAECFGSAILRHSDRLLVAELGARGEVASQHRFSDSPLVFGASALESLGR